MKVESTDLKDHLVIGASGLVGTHLYSYLTRLGYSVIGTSRNPADTGLQELEITDRSAVKKLIEEMTPKVVYVPAAMGNAEFCQQHPGDAYAINVRGIDNIVDVVRKLGCKLVFFSSDYVFDGIYGPYTEDDLPNPISVYGFQKILSEHNIAMRVDDFLIIRTTIVYGWEARGKNFIQNLINRLQIGESLSVAVDQIGTPTYAQNLAQATIELVDMDASGIFNLVGTELVSRYEFAVSAAKVFGLNESLIKPAFTSDLRQIAPRPLSAGLRVDKAQKKLKTQLLGYHDGLKLMAQERKEK